MSEQVRQAWAWFISALSMIAGTLELSHVLALLGIIVAILTIVERVYAIRLKRRQLGGAE